MQQKIPLSLVLMVGRRPLAAAFACTGLLSLLAFAGPVYMLLVYARALPQRDPGELLRLTAAMGLLYGLAAVADIARQRIFALRARAIDGLVIDGAVAGVRPVPVRDLDGVCAFLTGPAAAALCDLPFLPVYLLALYRLHPAFAAMAAVAALTVAGCLLAANLVSRGPTERAARLDAQRRTLAAQLADRGLSAASAGTRTRAWTTVHRRLREEQDVAARPVMLAAAMVRALRPALQSAMLGLGVYLVMLDMCAPASILIAAILLPRVLGPLEIALGQWRNIQSAGASAEKLRAFIAPAATLAPRAARSTAPAVRATLRASGSRVGTDERTAPGPSTQSTATAG
ncbi:MAG TPA: hypothetical protein VFF87_11140 [Hyphomicrobium sp.]|nr:hypothetical protein [Hyphomicrobium sp.]